MDHPSDPKLVKPALKEYQTGKRQQRKLTKKKILSEREEFFRMTLYPAILRYFALTLGEERLNNVRIKRVWWCRPRVVVRLPNIPIGYMGRGMRVWITSQGEIVIRHKFWAAGGTGGGGGGTSWLFPADLRFIAHFQNPRRLHMDTLRCIYAYVQSRSR